MTKVKICGIKTAEEAAILNRFVPDYAGFIFSKSRRIVSNKMATFLIKLLPAEVKKVGVFVNESVETVLSTQWECGLDVVQFSGEEDQSYIDRLKKSGYVKEIWKAVRVRDGSELLQSINADAILLDTYSEKAHGGTGEAFDWNIARGFAINNRIVLAGGLKPGNVRAAIDTLKPYCVDVSSGVEIDGYKDENLVGEFINAAKRR